MLGKNLASTIPLFPIPLEWGMGDTFPAFPARAGDGYMVGAGGPVGRGQAMHGASGGVYP